MDASIVDGKTTSIGSVVSVSDVDHPISLAKYALENHPNVILGNETAAKLAKELDNVRVVYKGNMISPAAYAACVSPGCSSFGVKHHDDASAYELPNLFDREYGCVTNS